MKSGLDSFAPHEALELLLFYAIPQQDTNALAHALIDRYGSLTAVFNAPVSDLITVKGVKETTAVLLTLVPKIYGLSLRQDALREEKVLNDSEDAGRFLLNCMSGERNEVVYMVSLNAEGKILYCEKLEEGTVNQAHLSSRKVVERALLHTASRVILGHNHPDGILSPSEEDIATTNRIMRALSAVNVRLDDHIIVAGGQYVSMRSLSLF